jgi:hypothetical protein
MSTVGTSDRERSSSAAARTVYWLERTIVRGGELGPKFVDTLLEFRLIPSINDEVGGILGGLRYMINY